MNVELRKRLYAPSNSHHVRVF